MIVEEGLWYVQKGSRVQGPFTPEEVGRFLLLGRVRNTDRVSRDGELWEPVTQVPELIPEALLDLGSEGGWSAYLAARAAGDERATLALTGATPGVIPSGMPEGMPEGRERRDASVDALTRARADWLQVTPPGAQRCSGRPAAASPGRSASVLPWSLLGLTLAALAVVLWLNATATVTG